MPLDDSLFVALNGHAHVWWLDGVMRTLTELSEMRALLIGGALLLVALLRGRARTVWIITLLALGLTDVMVSYGLKPLFHRPRPLDAGLPLRALVDLRHTEGFPSGHASTSAALAGAVAACGSRAAPWLMLLSAIMGYSRIYVGAHRPLDVLAGWLFGSLSGYLIAKLALWVLDRLRGPRLLRRGATPP